MYMYLFGWEVLKIILPNILYLHVLQILGNLNYTGHLTGCGKKITNYAERFGRKMLCLLCATKKTHWIMQNFNS